MTKPGTRRSWIAPQSRRTSHARSGFVAIVRSLWIDAICGASTRRFSVWAKDRRRRISPLGLSCAFERLGPCSTPGPSSIGTVSRSPTSSVATGAAGGSPRRRLGTRSGSCAGAVSCAAPTGSRPCSIPRPSSSPTPARNCVTTRAMTAATTAPRSRSHPSWWRRSGAGIRVSRPSRFTARRGSTSSSGCCWRPPAAAPTPTSSPNGRSCWRRRHWSAVTARAPGRAPGHRPGPAPAGRGSPGSTGRRSVPVTAGPGSLAGGLPASPQPPLQRDHGLHDLASPHAPARPRRARAPRWRQANLARLAADLGFADQSHLCRVVRAETGSTPSALRRAGRARRPRWEVAAPQSTGRASQSQSQRLK